MARIPDNEIERLKKESGAGAARGQAHQQIKRADKFFDSIGVTGDTATRIPRDRR